MLPCLSQVFSRFPDVPLSFSLLSNYIYPPKVLLSIQFHLLKAPLTEYKTKYKIYLIGHSRTFYRNKEWMGGRTALYLVFEPCSFQIIKKCYHLTFLPSTKSKNHLEPTHSSRLTSSCNEISLLMHFSN